MRITHILLAVGIALFSLSHAAAQETPEATAEAVYFTVTPAEIERGGEVTLQWEVRGAERVAIEQYYGYKTGYDVRYDDLPATGELTIRLTDSRATEYVPSVPYIYGAQFFLVLPDVPVAVWYFREGVLANASVTIDCPYDTFFFGSDDDELCPIGPAETVKVIYQPFAQGFMLWRSDTERLYLLSTLTDPANGVADAVLPQRCINEEDKAYACINPSVEVPKEIIERQNKLSGAVPEGVYRPANIFEEVWLYHGLAWSFGWATSPAVEYTTTLQDSYNGAFSSHVAYITLPDCRVVRYLENLYTGGWREVGSYGCEPAQP